MAATRDRMEVQWSIFYTGFNLQLHPAMGPAALHGLRPVGNGDGLLLFSRSNHNNTMTMTGSKAAGVIDKSFGCLRMPLALESAGCSCLHSTRRRFCLLPLML